MVHDNMYNVKYRQIGTLCEPVLFEPLKQIRVSHAIFEMPSFIDCGLYLKSFNSLEKYTGCLEEQLTNIVINLNHLSTVTDRIPPTGIGVSDHIKVHYQFHIMFMLLHQEIIP